MMKATINRLPLTHLWNSEYAIFVNQLIAILEKYEPDLLHLKKAFERLIAMLPDLGKIKAQEQSSALSISLHELDEERDTLIIAIASQVKTMGKLSLPAVAPHVTVLKRFLDIHGRDISNANYNVATERTEKMLADYDTKEDVKTAAEGLNLKILFEQLRMVNTNFARLFLQRTSEDAASEKIDVRAIRYETDKVLIAFFDAFEFCSTEYDDLDYTTPANEMNNLIDYYKTQLKARHTRRNNGVEVSKEAPIAEIPR